MSEVAVREAALVVPLKHCVVRLSELDGALLGLLLQSLQLLRAGDTCHSVTVSPCKYEVFSYLPRTEMLPTLRFKFVFSPSEHKSSPTHFGVSF